MMDGSKNTEIKSLPENIIFEILSYLPVKERCIAGRWFQSMTVWTKNECLNCSVFDVGTENHLELFVTLESNSIYVGVDVVFKIAGSDRASLALECPYQGFLLNDCWYQPLNDFEKQCQLQVFSAFLVCKRWRQIVASNSLWRHVNLLDYGLNLPKVWKILRAHFTPSLLSLRISGCGQRSNFTKASVSDALLKDLQARCPSIATLQLHDCSTSNLSLDFLPSSLTSLSVTSSWWQPRWLKGGYSHLPNLSSLTLDASVRVDNFDLEDIAQWTTGLRKLSLSGCYRIKGSGVEVVAKSCKSLEVLDLSYTGVDELGAHHIARHCNSLRELYLQHCSNMRDSWLSEIASGLRHLEVLDVSMRDCFTTEGIKVLWSLKKLKLFYFSTSNFEKGDEELIKEGFGHKIQVTHLKLS